MIHPFEIREHARTHGVPESTIERDYIQNWLLKMAQISHHLQTLYPLARRLYQARYQSEHF